MRKILFGILFAILFGIQAMAEEYVSGMGWSIQPPANLPPVLEGGTGVFHIPDPLGLRVQPYLSVHVYVSGLEETCRGLEDAAGRAGWREAEPPRPGSAGATYRYVGRVGEDECYIFLRVIPGRGRTFVARAVSPIVKWDYVEHRLVASAMSLRETPILTSDENRRDMKSLLGLLNN